ncbi:DUF6888 family protein [Nostoc sp.]|uniref:DUF6888 family protein n=1 Tax=Nostoc sp. TaxID=1180 RepID=UPI003FA59382
MKPTNEQTQGLYRLCYRLTNVIYPGWPYTNIELVRVDEVLETYTYLLAKIWTLRLNQPEGMNHDSS